MKKYAFVLFLGVVLFLAVYVIQNGAMAQAKKEPIKIGILADLTGGHAAYGYSHEKVMKAAVEKANKEGGAAGRPFQLFVEDTESKPSVGALKFRKLVETY